ncbi:GIY-YIG nuclease family protein [Vibrio cholerae]|uniref:GIY-YIG nuclease family protein n=1 Tax=Vibrio cholerae TaxID=666 RepID=UPI001DEA80A4|nr:GIY-YIG nuclease family protein [Vibrio cholerae]EGQ8592426.1 GIY-YIG nuclease family protein [Vibrio cholerae]EGQ8661835.1 GIY-YIG nuclease family protein [Vibrio cholerae]EJR3664188.1 GIY-YIG nuclease family protein [Vibrio cholerae]EKF9193825.1 GIY-YIG nuclease family protein [Vibrio cholerae]MCU4228249.1 GIY-YIG nuclease family protein [Vibrio cholerae]
MARKKKGGDALGGIVIVIVGIVIWLVSVVISGISYIHTNLVQFSSSPNGLIVMFFSLLILNCIVIGYFLNKKVRRQSLELDIDIETHNERVKNLDIEVRKKVDLEVLKERNDLERIRNELNDNKDKSRKSLQRLIDSAYKFKVKTLLSGISIKNQSTKYDQLKKEITKYKELQSDMPYFGLNDNSAWDMVAEQFYDKVALLEAAQDEKEAQDEIKRQMKEEKQRQDELERRQREAAEEENRLAEQRRLVEEALAKAEGQHREELEKQRAELERQIADVHSQYERAKSMAQLTKQGHVYVISNVGSFGENVFKIGMTRRLEPMDRVKELGDASVPFEFDVHAMISCDDAPALENALHTALNKHRMNKINLRKEFFKVELQKIIDTVERNHGTVEYVSDPIALQYYRSLEMDSEDVAA